MVPRYFSTSLYIVLIHWQRRELVEDHRSQSAEDERQLQVSIPMQKSPTSYSMKTDGQNTTPREIGSRTIVLGTKLCLVSWAIVS